MRVGKVLAGICALAAFLVLPAVLPVPVLPVSGKEAAPPVASAVPAASAAPEVSPPDAPYRAVWVSYLEWQNVDFSSAASFTADVSAMLDNIAALGANVVLAHVRPFGDALYPSAYYPFSHLCTGTQGQDPGYDPLALLVAVAHARGLQVEAWVNPYRLQLSGGPALCGQSPGVLHPEWCKQTADGTYLDPASAEVRAYIAAGLAELCEHYAIDGIHFDDYFYPTTDPGFDAETYAAYQAGGGALDLDGWRRENVNALVSLCWQTVHQYEGVRFGIAPQGNPANLGAQYSDAALWLAEPGYVDYLMPQLYWGLEYPDAALRLDALAAVWAAFPRAETVRLYAGLGAYRIGDGDTENSAEWLRGNALATQLSALEQNGITGTALYRYASLFENSAWPELAGQERQALTARWRAG